MSASSRGRGRAGPSSRGGTPIPRPRTRAMSLGARPEEGEVPESTVDQRLSELAATLRGEFGSLLRTQVERLQAEVQALRTTLTGIDLPADLLQIMESRTADVAGIQEMVVNLQSEVGILRSEVNGILENPSERRVEDYENFQRVARRLAALESPLEREPQPVTVQTAGAPDGADGDYGSSDSEDEQRSSKKDRRSKRKQLRRSVNQKGSLKRRKGTMIHPTLTRLRVLPRAQGARRIRITVPRMTTKSK